MNDAAQGDTLADAWLSNASSAHNGPTERAADHAKSHYPLMLERYLQEDDPLQRFLASPAEQITQQEKKAEEQQMDMETKNRSIADPGGERRSRLAKITMGRIFMLTLDTKISRATVRS